MAINRKIEPGECERCGLLYQTDPEKRRAPEFCTWCAQFVIVDVNTGVWAEKGEKNADHPKK